MAARFYVNGPLDLGPVELEGPEAHHLAAVCRLGPGHQVCLFNGDGREYAASVKNVARRTVELEITAIETVQRELVYPLEIAAPLPKGDRAQFLIEKLTELGVTSFVPLRTRRSVVHPSYGKLEKLQRDVIEACKQCGRNVLLRVLPLTDWELYCKRNDLAGSRWLAHPGGVALPSFAGGGKVIAVGPEGGFEEAEVELARQAGWQVVGLGPRILRIETAAIALAAQCAF